MKKMLLFGIITSVLAITTLEAACNAIHKVYFISKSGIRSHKDFKNIPDHLVKVDCDSRGTGSCNPSTDTQANKDRRHKVSDWANEEARKLKGTRDMGAPGPSYHYTGQWVAHNGGQGPWACSFKGSV